MNIRTPKPNRGIPVNIYPREDGIYISVQRGTARLDAFIARRARSDAPYQSHIEFYRAIQQAVRIRDRFLIQAGPQRVGKPMPGRTGKEVKSNTGVHGISETVKWVKYKPHYCFSVWLGKHHKPKMKRVYYGRERTRNAALEKAIALRARVVGKRKSKSGKAETEVCHGH